VDDHRHAISRQTNVKLDPVGSSRNRGAKRRHGVFRRHGRRAAMPDDQWCSHKKAQKPQKLFCAFLWLPGDDTF
jgi:hypothetical protein